MDTERLIQLIEAEVRKALAQQSESQVSAPLCNDEEMLLVIFTGSSVGLDAAVAQVEKLSGHGYHLRLVLCPMAIELAQSKLERLSGPIEMVTEERLAEVGTIVASCDAVVVPVLSRTAAAKLALGIADNFALALVFEALTLGKRVVLATDAADPSRAGSPSVSARTPKAILQLAQHYLKTLESFGAQLVPVSRLSQVFEPGGTHEHLADGAGKTLITRSVIANLAPGVRELIVPNPAIITPLARDLARERGITLRLEKRD